MLPHHHNIIPAAKQLDPRPTLASGASSACSFTMRRAHFVQVGRGIAGAFKARGVVQ